MALLSSCTIQENIHFNADFSGNYKIKVDMSALAGFGAAMGDSTATAPESMFTPEQLDSMRMELASVPGITNMSVTEESYVLSMSLDFDKLETFASFNAMDPNNTAGNANAKPRFEKSGNNLVYNFDADAIKEAMGTASEGDDASMDDMGMNEMFTFQTVLTFEKPVKKVQSKIAELNKETNEVVFNYNLKDAIEKGNDWKTTISLGK